MSIAPARGFLFIGPIVFSCSVAVVRFSGLTTLYGILIRCHSGAQRCVSSVAVYLSIHLCPQCLLGSSYACAGWVVFGAVEGGGWEGGEEGGYVAGERVGRFASCPAFLLRLLTRHRNTRYSSSVRGILP